MVLIGHSFGGTAAIVAAQRLALEHIPVALLVSLDAAAQYTTVIPPTVERCLCFYQRTPGQLGQGVDVEGKGWDHAEWHKRVTFYQRADTHLGIANEPFVHDKILAALAEIA